MRKASKQFVLMELLTIIMIIILLITIILPTVIKAREWGKSIVCKSNTQTIGKAFLSYCNDSGGTPPPYTYNPPTWPLFGIVYPSFNQLPAYLTGAYSNYDYMLKLRSVSDGTVLNSQTGSYLPIPKYKYKVNLRYGGTWFNLVLPYPIDNSSAFACPAQKKDYYNELLYKQVGSSYSWMGSHYAMGAVTTSGCKTIMSRKNFAKATMIGDTWGISQLADSIHYDDCYVYGRHFGTPNYCTPFTGSSVLGRGYREHGPGYDNWSMLDGHVESWTWRTFYNQYRSSGSWYILGASPFYVGNW